MSSRSRSQAGPATEGGLKRLPSMNSRALVHRADIGAPVPQEQALLPNSSQAGTPLGGGAGRDVGA